MKNFIFTCFIILTTVFAQAQTTKPIDGFLGIKFGSTPAQVIEALKAKGGIEDKDYNSRYNQTGKLAFDNISLGNRKSAALFVYFVNDQAFQSEFVFQPNLEPESIEYYNKLITDISDVYGPGISAKNFKQPYTDGDGYEITAIKSGKADYQTSWTINNNLIWLRIEPNKKSEILVRLVYRDGHLIEVYRQQQKEKNKTDF